MLRLGLSENKGDHAVKQFLVIAIIVGCMSIPARAQMGSNLSSPPEDFSQNFDQQAQNSQSNGNGNVGGCEDSPENPTIILAGLAMAGFGVAQWRRKRSTLAEMKLRPSNAK